jgi:hypothetical protein
MRTRAGALIALVAGLSGCSGERAGLFGVDPSLTAADLAASDPADAERQATRSVWAIVPAAPRRKADLRPAMIRGAAVAVSADTLLASCLATEGRSRVGLVRHKKYRMAEVEADGGRRICRLTVAEGPLTPAVGYRSFGNLRTGEPVVALVSRTSSEIALARGWLAGKGAAADPFLETTSAVPAGSGSVVLVDRFGNLIGLGASEPLADAAFLAVPIGPRNALSLVNRDLRVANLLLTALSPPPAAQPRQAPIVLALGDDNDSAARDQEALARSSARDPDEANSSGSPPRGSSGGPSGGTSGPGSAPAGSPPAAPGTSDEGPSTGAPDPGGGGAGSAPTGPPGPGGSEGPSTGAPNPGGGSSTGGTGPDDGSPGHGASDRPGRHDDRGRGHGRDDAPGRDHSRGHGGDDHGKGHGGGKDSDDD